MALEENKNNINVIYLKKSNLPKEFDIESDTFVKILNISGGILGVVGVIGFFTCT